MSLGNINSEKLVSALRKVFDKDRFEIDSIYGGSSISVRGKDDTYVYIRVYHKDNTCEVDISNIILGEKIQRSGYFSSTVQALLSLDFVEAVIVSSVVTKDMHKACLKNNFEVCEMYSGYIKRSI